MCDTKWGFNTNYGHRTLPFKWQSSNGFHFYEESPLTKKNFRPAHLPALREDFLPMTTHYGERGQDKRWAMSGYGCHRNLIWDESLRMPRNPFAGKPNREMTYIKEVPLSTPRRLAQWDMQRTMRGASTPRKNFTPMLPELNQRHRDVLDKSADELAQMMKLFED